MGNSIDDGFGYSFLGKLVFRRGLDAMFPGTDASVNFRQDEINGLINQLEDRAFENLIRRDGFADHGVVEVKTFDLGGQQKALRFLAEQEDRCVRGFSIVQQIEMGQRFFAPGIYRQGVITFMPGGF
jgi:hypothetical protein